MQVPLDGVAVDFVNPDVKLPNAAVAELRWCVRVHVLCVLVVCRHAVCAATCGQTGTRG
jgi:hypothetical protein